MLLERIYDDDLSQASYFIGCQAVGEAIVVDPRRDLDEYLQLARKNDMRIVAVTETHIHADYLSGTRELAAKTGAQIYISDEGGPDWTYGPEFDVFGGADSDGSASQGAVRMKHGHEITLGHIRVRAVHTPGHTPEHMSFLVTDGAHANEPGFMLTGDFVFVGDVGRPDLLDETAGGIGTRFSGAKEIFASLRNQFLTLPDYVQVLPGHGSGSACGKALGAIPATTVGYEREFSWWAKYFVTDDQQGFVDELLSGQPDAHAYFARMKIQNKIGPTIIGELSELIEYSADQLLPALASDDLIFVDTRHHALVHEGTVERSLNIPGVGKTASFGAWVYDPERENRPLVLLAHSRDKAEQIRDHLVRVGIDIVSGFITSLDGVNLVAPKLVKVEDLEHCDRVQLLDIRNKTEYAEGFIPGAEHLNAGRVMWELDRLSRTGTIVTYCQSGVRNSVTTSALRREGFDVAELDGSYLVWEKSQRVVTLPANINGAGHAKLNTAFDQ